MVLFDYRLDIENPLENCGLLSKDLGVILIDMQKDFVQGIYPVNHKQKILQCQINVFNECIRKDIPVVVLESLNHGKTIDCLMEKINAVPRGRVFTKTKSSGFSNIDFEIQLSHFEIRQLFLMGLYASYCIKETAEDAIKRGMKVYVSKSVIGKKHYHTQDMNKTWYDFHCSFF